MMANKKSPGRPQLSSAHKDTIPKPRGVAVLDRMLLDVKELVDAQEFRTAGEAEAFMRGLFAAHSLPWLSGDISDFPGSPLDVPGINPIAASNVARDSLADAQELIYDAWEAPTSRAVVRLARKALEISPDCADAYVILANETARTPLAARKLFEQGVAAGERALGPRPFREDIGSFWGILETRPYMRARVGLATALWELGESDAAIGHVQDMLRLNPNDNQGVRYALLSWLLAKPDGNGDAAKLLAKFRQDHSAYWLYGRALHLFKSGGAGKAATNALRKAVEYNPHVTAYLSGERKLPTEIPEYIEHGKDDEATVYAAENMGLWSAVPGALEWLRKNAVR